MDDEEDAPTLPEKLPAAPLLRALATHRTRRYLTKAEHAASLGIAQAVYVRLCASETVTLGMADRICSRMGTGLDDVYGPDWDLAEAS